MLHNGLSSFSLTLLGPKSSNTNRRGQKKSQKQLRLKIPCRMGRTGRKHLGKTGICPAKIDRGILHSAPRKRSGAPKASSPKWVYRCRTRSGPGPKRVDQRAKLTPKRGHNKIHRDPKWDSIVDKSISVLPKKRKEKELRSSDRSSKKQSVVGTPTELSQPPL